MRRLIAPEEWKPRGIDELEPNAEKAVRSDRSMSVTAGPGAGKTELLAQRASFLLETGTCAYPRRILAISFKRDAAKNLRERVLKRSGETLGRRLDSFTFDAFAKGVLDQFLAALPPNMRPTSEYDVLVKDLAREEIEEMLLDMDPPAALGSRNDLRQFARRGFFTDEIPRAPFRSEPTTLTMWAARAMWAPLLHGGERSKLSFRMITRLAGELFRRDARLRRAYRATYSHVFLDEFQDTTDLQYWLTSVLFRDTAAILTAVGDPKQRIMGWAGALKRSFGKFEKEFGAEPTELERNHRASNEIAPVVRHIAEELAAAAGASRAAIAQTLPGGGPPADACGAYAFADEGAEALWLAEQIAALLAVKVPPREIAILVRMKADEYAARVLEVLRERGISCRIEDRMQDLLTEPIVEVVILALRALACDRPRSHWSEFREAVADLSPSRADTDGEWNRLERKLETIRRDFRGEHPSVPDAADGARGVIRTFVEPLVEGVRGQYGQYRRGSFYEETLQHLSGAIATSSSAAGWSAALDEVEGVGAVPILTIHKSKGLEYQAVFFLGLEDGAFWNFRRNPDEETSAFFVALSRAKKRVAFTFAQSRARNGKRESQSVSDVGELYKLMRRAGVRLISP